ncbi:hypothetical protein ABD70_03505 [Alkalihalobacillus lehensis]|nr:hypothetical protein [Shouchella lehensis]
MSTLNSFLKGLIKGITLSLILFIIFTALTFLFIDHPFLQDLFLFSLLFSIPVLIGLLIISPFLPLLYRYF